MPSGHKTANRATREMDDRVVGCVDQATRSSQHQTHPCTTVWKQCAARNAQHKPAGNDRIVGAGGSARGKEKRLLCCRELGRQGRLARRPGLAACQPSVDVVEVIVPYLLRRSRSPGLQHLASIMADAVHRPAIEMRSHFRTHFACCCSTFPSRRLLASAHYTCTCTHTRPLDYRTKL